MKSLELWTLCKGQSKMADFINFVWLLSFWLIKSNSYYLFEHFPLADWQIAAFCSFTTSTDHCFRFLHPRLPDGTTRIEFSVKTQSDAFIVLSSENRIVNPAQSYVSGKFCFIHTHAWVPTSFRSLQEILKQICKDFPILAKSDKYFQCRSQWSICNLHNFPQFANANQNRIKFWI